MPLTVRLPVFSLVLFLLFSCNKQPSEESNGEEKRFSLEIVDSVLVDYLGDMKLIAYDDQNRKYLITDNSGRNYLEVSEQGEILTENVLKSDGLNAVSYVSGLGYLDGKVAVLTDMDGYYLFQDTTKVGEIAIPYPHRTVVFYNKLGIFSEDNRIYFQKPWPQNMDLSMNDGAFYEKLYQLPIIESMGQNDSDTLAALRLPETSALLDGQVHGILTPSYTRVDDYLLLSMQFRPEIYVYQKQGGGFEYLETVPVDIPDWVPYEPVPKENADRFYSGMFGKQVGVLSDILQVDGYYLAIYSKGIPEEKMPAKEDDQNLNVLNSRKANPFYAAVFDQDFNQLATDIPFPASSNFPTVVNRYGEIVVSKIAGLSETEDDGVVLYKLKLSEK